MQQVFLSSPGQACDLCLPAAGGLQGSSLRTLDLLGALFLSFAPHGLSVRVALSCKGLRQLCWQMWGCGMEQSFCQGLPCLMVQVVSHCGVELHFPDG